MRLFGYQRPPPNPISPGVMAATPRTWMRRLPRPRWHLVCMLRGHKQDFERLTSRGEQWTVFVFTCMRCDRVVGDSHAAKSDWPVC